MSEPAAAATRGANSRSHVATPFGSAADSDSTSAAPTGVANIAPIVPAAANPIHCGAGTRPIARRPSQIARATLIATIGFSGPRLTPPPRLITTTIARPGSTAGASGGDTSDWVAGSGPAWPGTRHTRIPVTRPTKVRTPMIHTASLPSSPRPLGTTSQRRSSQRVGEHAERDQRQRAAPRRRGRPAPQGRASAWARGALTRPPCSGPAAAVM